MSYLVVLDEVVHRVVLLVIQPAPHHPTQERGKDRRENQPSSLHRMQRTEG